MPTPAVKKNFTKTSNWLIFILLACLGLGYLIFLKPNFPADAGRTHKWRVMPGTSFGKVVDYLAAEKIIEHPFTFELAARLTNKMNRIQVGEYKLSTGKSNLSLLQQLISGKVSFIKVTIPEGKDSRYIAGILKTKLEIDSTRFVTLVHDSATTSKMGITAPALEGYLFPDTYYFTWGMNATQCIRTMVGQFKKNVPDSLRRPEDSLSLHELVILASLIEGEVMLVEEGPIVSGLYRNRLKKRMLLQACPTIQYIIPNSPRRLLDKDLEIQSPYNTYIYPGLPPGPINNPGLKALKAAANPDSVNYLFMVARGDGGHTFSRTLSGHINAKKHFEAYRHRINRKMQQH